MPMSTSPLHDAAQRYFDATGGGKLPALPDNLADAAAAVLRARPLKTWACAFGVVDLADPWPALACAEGDVTPHEVTWALGCADLVPCGTAHDGSVLVIDRAVDPSGAHRAFFVTRRGEVLGPWFSSTTSLVEWAAALAESPNDDDDPSELDREPPPRDIWNRSSLSGVGALPLWRQLSPALFYRAAANKGWPELGADPGALRAGDPTRTNLLRLVGRFAKTRSLVLPPAIDAEQLTDAQRTLLARYSDLAHALEAGEVPAYIASLAEDDDGAVAAAARAWVTRFQGARAARRATPKPARGAERAETDPLKAVFDAISKCLQGLATEGAIEISAKNRAELTEEIVAAMMKAPTADRAVAAAVHIVNESPLVDEVFADDVLLRKAFRKVLGGA
jgi:hypothetical protein